MRALGSGFERITRLRVSTEKFSAGHCGVAIYFNDTVKQIPEELPTGTWNWQVGAEGGICLLHKGDVHEMTLSRCFSNQYTCDSGNCIILSSKCDTNIDCEDKSDEINCAYMKLPSNYAKELIPRDGDGSPVVVNMNVSFLAFPIIDVFSLKFTVSRAYFWTF